MNGLLRILNSSANTGSHVSPVHVICAEHSAVEDTFSTFSPNECLLGEPAETFAAEAITPEQIRMSLKRLHNNLGHPSNQDLVRVLNQMRGVQRSH